MCELFGVSSLSKQRINEMLREFYSHSDNNPDGWGLAVFTDGMAVVEKEPARADTSGYLKERLRNKIYVSNAIAHIRKASKGNIAYENCHPFVKQDGSGRQWTLAHNGTMFQCPALDSYYYRQAGQTDSERILYYLIDRIDSGQKELGRTLEGEDRFAVIDGALLEIGVGNKMNLLIFDGQYFYVYKNFADSLYFLQREDSAFFSTRPLGNDAWEAVPMSTLQVWEGGRLIYKGKPHQYEYIENPKDTESLFLDYSLL